jgi:hypothetical protein
MTDTVIPRLRPVTLDGRYFVERGQLFRRSNPALDAEQRKQLTFELIAARSAALHARRRGDAVAEAAAQARIETAKIALGQRGAPWWQDAAPDLARKPVGTTPYAPWFAALKQV